MTLKMLSIWGLVRIGNSIRNWKLYCYQWIRLNIPNLCRRLRQISRNPAYGFQDFMVREIVFGKCWATLSVTEWLPEHLARDRILQRFTGIEEEALIKNNIRRLDSVNSRVVFLDIAKQDTSKGLSYTLFRNFLKTLELPQNEHGYLLYHLMISENFRTLRTTCMKIQELTGQISRIVY